MGKKVTKEEFIRKAKEVHGDKYDYSKAEYKSKKTKICIICPEHGEFWQIAESHLAKHGCPKCAIEKHSETKRLNTEEFIKKACEIHGDKYDYSKVKYINSRTNVCIICPKHGEFLQNPTRHLMGRGCPNCGNKKMNTKDFIERAKMIYGDRYDYSKVEYKSSSQKVCIICPIHGEFHITPNNHLRGHGCPQCNSSKQLTTEDFIERARAVHGDKYDYSKVKYVNSHTKVCIICPIHGEFEQYPSAHLKGHGCKKCVNPNYEITTEEWIKKAKKVHGDKYDYTKVNYVNSLTKVCIICPEHGKFEQAPHNHLSGQGCPVCGRNSIWDTRSRITTEEFVRRAKEVHGNKYDYSKVEYKGTEKSVTIICPVHGEFQQTPYHHLSGQGCPNCSGIRKQYKFNLLKEFESEYDFRAFLNNSDINILQVILRNIEPKFDPIKQDIERALEHSNEVDPIKALTEKYASDSEDESDEEFNIATAPNVDLDNAIDSIVYVDVSKNDDTTTIDEVIKNTEREIKVINKVEHMLTPEDREYIMNKFLNDKRRTWILERENSVK